MKGRVIMHISPKQMLFIVIYLVLLSHVPDDDLDAAVDLVLGRVAIDTAVAAVEEVTLTIATREKLLGIDAFGDEIVLCGVGHFL